MMVIPGSSRCAAHGATASRAASAPWRAPCGHSLRSAHRGSPSAPRAPGSRPAARRARSPAGSTPAARARCPCPIRGSHPPATSPARSRRTAPAASRTRSSAPPGRTARMPITPASPSLRCAPRRRAERERRAPSTARWPPAPAARDRQTIHDQSGNRNTIRLADAEIAAGEPADPDQVALEHRLIEPELVPQRRQRLRLRLGPSITTPDRPAALP